MGSVLSDSRLGQGGKADSKDILHQNTLIPPVTSGDVSGEDESDSPTKGPEDLETSISDRDSATQIRALSGTATLPQLEKGVEKGTQVAEELDAILSKCPSEIKGSLDLSRAVKNLTSQNSKTQVIIGVVGQTGAGKSSVINAILDEEQIVPTNCMRACTAVVTEIAYNHEQQPYRGEIEFITPDEWKNEMEILFRDLQDDTDTDEKSRKSAKSNFAIAQAKIKAVYPSLEDVLRSSPDELVRHKSVCDLLGSKIPFSEDDPARFYDRLQSYVDSKKKNKRKKSRKVTEKTKAELQDSSELEFWPLIRVVRLYLKASVLSTGAVIVDLPGTQDSNAARAAVANKYLEKCTGLWIVAPINRAVNDRTAQKFLDDSTRNQLKMDCGFNKVTVICSKTDDIRVAEVQDSLDLSAESSLLSEKLEEIERKRKSLPNSLKILRRDKAKNAESLEQANEHLDDLSDLLDSLEDGIPLKREPEDDVDNRPLKMARLYGSGNRSNTSTCGVSPDGIEPSTEVCQEPTTAEETRKRMKEVRIIKRGLYFQGKELASKIRDVENELAGMNTFKEDARNEFHSQCILARSQYTKATVQEDFALSIRELDRDIAQHKPDFDPNIDERDYDALAKSLAVFCVSSRAYQVLQGRFAGEQLIPGFRTPEHTEITQLQAHCIKSTEAERRRNSNQYLNNLDQLLNSLRLWASAVSRTLTDEELHKFKEKLGCKLSELHADLDKLAEETYSRFMVELRLCILGKFDYASTYAAKEAVKVDWNKDMAAPLLTIISSGWERFFTTKGPAVFDSFNQKSRDLLESFHQDIETYAKEKEINSTSFRTLKQQLETYHENVKEISLSMTETMNEKQKIINREYSVSIQKVLGEGYDACQEEKGRGLFNRMKHIMMNTVEESRHLMFKQTTKKANSKLQSMARGIKKDLASKLKDVKGKISSDYQLVISKLEEEKSSPAELRVKAQILEVLTSAESDFRRIMKLEEGSENLGNNSEGKVESLDGAEEVLPPTEQIPGAMGGETSQDKMANVKVEENGEPVPGSEVLKEISEEMPTAEEQSSGSMEGIETGPDKTENVKVEGNGEAGEVPIAAEQRLGPMEGVETSLDEPENVKVEGNGEAASGSTEEVPTAEQSLDSMEGVETNPHGLGGNQGAEENAEAASGTGRLEETSGEVSMATEQILEAMDGMVTCPEKPENMDVKVKEEI